MMKIFLTAIIFLISKSLFSQSTFQLILRDSIRNIGQSQAYQTPDSGFVISDYSFDYINNVVNSNFMTVTKIDKNGSIRWSKAHNLPDNFKSDLSTHHIVSTVDGGSIIIGASNSYGVGINLHQSHIFVLQVDSLGNRQWMKYFDPERIFSQSYTGSGIAINHLFRNSDGSYSMAGEISIPDSSNKIVPFCMKSDSLGNIISTRIFPSFVYPCCELDRLPVCKDYEGNIVISNSFFYSPGFELSKIDTSLNVIKCVKTISEFSPYEIRQTADSGFIMGGTVGASPNTELAFSFSDKNLITQFYFTAGSVENNEYLTDVIQTSDLNFVASGLIGKLNSSTFQYEYTPFLMKFNNNKILWARTYSKFNCNNISVGGRKIINTTDHGFLLYGFIMADSVDGKYISPLLKVDSLGHSGCAETNISFGQFHYYSNISSVGSNYSSIYQNQIANNLFVPLQYDYNLNSRELCSSSSDTSFHYLKMENVTTFPNPVKGKLKIVLPPSDLDILSADVYNMLGQIIYHFDFEKLNHCQYCDADRMRELNLDRLANGMYFLMLITNRNSYLLKVVKQ